MQLKVLQNKKFPLPVYDQLLKMPAINKVPLLPVLWRHCRICHLGILDPFLEKFKLSSGIYVVGMQLYVSA